MLVVRRCASRDVATTDSVSHFRLRKDEQSAAAEDFATTNDGRCGRSVAVLFAADRDNSGHALVCAARSSRTLRPARSDARLLPGLVGPVLSPGVDALGPEPFAHRAGAAVSSYCLLLENFCRRDGQSRSFADDNFHLRCRMRRRISLAR